MVNAMGNIFVNGILKFMLYWMVFTKIRVNYLKCSNICKYILCQIIVLDRFEMQFLWYRYKTLYLPCVYMAKIMINTYNYETGKQFEQVYRGFGEG